MEDYAKSLEEIQIREAKADEILTKEELKGYRKSVGKIELVSGKHKTRFGNICIGFSKKIKEGND